MPLQIDELGTRQANQDQHIPGNNEKGIQVAHLCPSNIRRDKELNVSVTENAEDGAPKIPVGETAPSFEQLGGGIFMA
jgi:hypothetical protein